ncbi:hypothetical protein PTSG_01831 [Salpingoeca rosetta]|uniref:Uncharacterized protein n=1 Tax=Salpingoeca rosetta (strain ATCC 50818 / BSB-021) TaxID=946362 RepID=F2TZ29_SALR5|nr:uncharacterized protein PTSG_01831 [Salpingoeca rosetta]EGD78853.1 hypothetical protein PTSG_01831 [Salpingoeca rosetta]|eukprot:XP_004997809.1 hypothetical protein PTSG_01831 [Salpingoeca rosetta]
MNEEMDDVEALFTASTMYKELDQTLQALDAFAGHMERTGESLESRLTDMLASLRSARTGAQEEEAEEDGEEGHPQADSMQQAVASAVQVTEETADQGAHIFQRMAAVMAEQTIHTSATSANPPQPLTLDELHERMREAGISTESQNEQAASEQPQQEEAAGEQDQALHQ